MDKSSKPLAVVAWNIIATEASRNNQVCRDDFPEVFGGEPRFLTQPGSFMGGRDEQTPKFANERHPVSSRSG